MKLHAYHKDVAMCLHRMHSVLICLAGSSPFGVSLLGGVRDSCGQLQTFVNSVDERHHRGEGSGIREGMCMHTVHVPLHAAITAS